MRNYLKQQRAACLREAGLTWKAVAEALGVSAHRAQQLAGYGQDLGQPDEIIFPRFLRAETPIRFLPVSKLIRDRLIDAGVKTCGELLTDRYPTLRRDLLRYPNFGRAKLIELDQVVDEWRASIGLSMPAGSTEHISTKTLHRQYSASKTLTSF